MINQAQGTAKNSQILEIARAEMQRHFDIFAKSPTVKNGSVLGRAMTDYGRAFADAERSVCVRRKL